MGFISTYKLYKQGTSQVVAWLGKTATLCGYVMGSGDPSKQGRKTAKKTVSKSNGDSSSDLEGQVMKVTVKELPALAKVIAKNLHQQMSAFQTLPDILKVLKDVIIKRKQWGKSFRVSDARTLASNIGHEHFVNILEDVYKILVAIPSALQTDKEEAEQTSFEAARDGESASIETGALSNPFAVLYMEEPVDQVEIPKSRSGPAKMTYERGLKYHECNAPPFSRLTPISLNRIRSFM